VLGCVAMFVAAQAGRVGEDGSGAMWIASELLPKVPVGEPCSHDVRPASPDVVFEVIHWDDAAEEARLIRGSSRAVAFDLNETTSELSLAESSATAIFGDLVDSTVVDSPLRARSCGSP
jgi:hypothetical protein